MKNTVLFLFIAILMLSLVLAGCTTTPSVPAVQTTAPPTATPEVTPLPTVATTEGLTDTLWELVSYQGPQVSAANVLAGSVVTAEFRKDGILTGSSGCNQYTASYKQTLGSLSIEPPMVATMICSTPTGVMTQESVYLLDLEKASTFRIDGDLLTVYDSAGTAILTYRRNTGAQTASLPLTLTTWNLVSYDNSKGTMVNLVKNTAVTAVFSDGNITGNAGCNDYFGSFIATENEMTIGEIGSTRMFCGDPGVMDQETAYLRDLNRVKFYFITGSQLTCADKAGNPILVYSGISA